MSDISDETKGPCDVWIPGSSSGTGRFAGTEPVAWLKKHASDNNACPTVRLRPWQASTEDHKALRAYQLDLLKAGKGWARS